MFKRLTFLISFLLCTSTLTAQVFEVDTLLYSGDPAKFINFVFMGDGYTSTEQDDFIADATKSMNSLFTKVPFKHYKASFNVFAIKVISNESGAKHPNTAGDCAGSNVPVSDPDNYFGSTFDNFGVHRLIYPADATPVYSVLAANCPFYDEAVLLVNTQYYGGAGGDFCTLSTDANVNEVLAHELGHSFAGLADEYYAGEAYFNERPNMTHEADSTKIRWKNWVGSNSIGINPYCCGGTADEWFKPHTNCKMEFLGKSFCSVCSQTIVERIHELVNPLVSYSPANLTISNTTPLLDFELTKLIDVVPSTYKIKWKLNENVIASNVKKVQLDQTTFQSPVTKITVTIEDTSKLIRVDNHSSTHFSTVTWTVNRFAGGLEILPEENRVSIALFPNPAANQITATLDLEKSALVTIQLVSMDGRNIATPINNQQSGSSQLTIPIDLTALPSGLYKVLFTIDGVVYSESVVKE